MVAVFEWNEDRITYPIMYLDRILNWTLHIISSAYNKCLCLMEGKYSLKSNEGYSLAKAFIRLMDIVLLIGLQK